MSHSDGADRRRLEGVREFEGGVAFRDELTGLFNRRVLSRLLEPCRWPPTESAGDVSLTHSRPGEG